ncbi:MAG: nucleotide exchange factor GrpE, partial [Candidatus Marinimicrobia bacterium]|nr:nucleotide exchange factor GrpE [Candidatus Neomarinimicrobiota bacterium]
ELHDAMLVMNDQNKPDHEILQEPEKGYMYKDKVLRHAKVVVNKK